MVIEVLTLKIPITTEANSKLWDIFLIFEKKSALKFHVNHLLADDSHEISSLIWILLKLLQIVCGALRI